MTFNPIANSVDASGKYRIITDGNKYRIQERFLYFFWSGVLTADSHGENERPYEFDLYNDALEQIKVLVHMDELDRYRWKGTTGTG